MHAAASAARPLPCRVPARRLAISAGRRARAGSDAIPPAFRVRHLATHPHRHPLINNESAAACSHAAAAAADDDDDDEERPQEPTTAVDTPTHPQQQAPLARRQPAANTPSDDIRQGDQPQPSSSRSARPASIAMTRRAALALGAGVVGGGGGVIGAPPACAKLEMMYEVGRVLLHQLA
jgi:hypothetical protein